MKHHSELTTNLGPAGYFIILIFDALYMLWVCLCVLSWEVMSQTHTKTLTVSPIGLCCEENVNCNSIVLVLEHFCILCHWSVIINYCDLRFTFLVFLFLFKFPLLCVFITSAEEDLFSPLSFSLFVFCLVVHSITQKLQNGLPWNLVDGWDIGQDSTSWTLARIREKRVCVCASFQPFILSQWKLCFHNLHRQRLWQAQVGEAGIEPSTLWFLTPEPQQSWLNLRWTVGPWQGYELYSTLRLKWINEWQWCNSSIRMHQRYYSH